MLSHHPVSVIIPCYNHGEFIDDAINSVLNQSYPVEEIFIVNDGSTDVVTNEKLNCYVNPKTNIINITNSGPSGARNCGIKSAKNELILILDADDYFEKTFIEKAINILHNYKQVGVITCGVRSFGAKNKIWHPQGGDVRDFILKNNCASSCLFRKKCWEEVNGYNEDIREGFEDWDFWLSITSKGWLIYSINEVLLNYRVHENSRYQQAILKKTDSFKKILQNHLDIYAQNLGIIMEGKEEEIEYWRSRYLDLKHSTSYQLGKTLLTPFIKVKKWVCGGK